MNKRSICKNLLGFFAAVLAAMTIRGDDALKAPSPAVPDQVKMPKISLSKSKWLWCRDAPNAGNTLNSIQSTKRDSVRTAAG